MSVVFIPTRTKITAQRFQDMIASGVLRDDERIELIDGEMMDIAPTAALEAWTVVRLGDLLRMDARPNAHVWAQLPVALVHAHQWGQALPFASSQRNAHCSRLQPG